MYNGGVPKAQVPPGWTRRKTMGGPVKLSMGIQDTGTDHSEDLHDEMKMKPSNPAHIAKKDKIKN